MNRAYEVCRGAAAMVGVILAVLLPLAATSRPAPGQTVTAARLAAGGSALHPVVVSSRASARVRAAAADLAEYLGRISGAEFRVVEGDGRTGVAVGTAADFNGISLPRWDPKDMTQREDYVLRSHASGVHVIGTTDLAVENAVWDLLYRLGHRQFFPGENWEVVPRTPTLSVTVDAVEHPDYYSRYVWYDYSMSDYNQEPYRKWILRNRLQRGIAIASGHTYGLILRQNRAAFDAHPEYLGLVDGQRKSTKFCISNPGLRQLVVDWALKQFEKNPTMDSISMEPSDGAGWCECDRCQAIGSPSDRAVTLANTVAEAVQRRFGPRYVGIYAYNFHSPPPRVRVNPQVVVSIATAYIQGNYSVEELIEGWKRQGATIGIREYYAQVAKERDLPGRSRASQYDYLARTTPLFHRLGARFLSSQTGDSWGPNGLGHFMAARMLWDVDEASRVDALREDFLQKAFGPAQAPMREFYELLDGRKAPLLSDDLVGRMYRSLASARRLASDAATRRRIDDLVRYTGYVDQWQEYSTSPSGERLAAFEKLIRYAWSIRKSMMVHVVGLYRDLPLRDKTIRIPAGAEWNAPQASNPWKQDPDLTEADVERKLREGQRVNRLRGFEAVEFTENLVPAARMGLAQVTPGTLGNFVRGRMSLHVWIDSPNRPLQLRVRSGLVISRPVRVELDLFRPGEEDRPVDSATAAGDKEERTVQLRAPARGLYRLELRDENGGTALSWPDGTPVSVLARPEDPVGFYGRYSLYFYVPRGTRTVGGFAAGVGTLLDGSGKQVHTFSPRAEYFSVPVPPGQDGTLWKFQNCVGQRLLMTVPSVLARTGEELLLPEEVVRKDSRR